MDREGLKDEQLSLKLGRKLSRSQISRIRRGDSFPTQDNARLLETVTGISAGAFVLGDAAPKRRAA